jgi:predicted RNase H-like nuclease (RuvC/YqgF family)
MEGQGEQQQQQQQQQQEQLQQLRQQIVDGERTISMLREQFQQETDTDVRRALQQQVTAKEQRVTALQQEVTAKEQQVSAKEQQVSAKEQLVTAKELQLLRKGTRLHPFPSSMHHLHLSLSMLEQTCMSSDYLANNQAPQLGHDCRRRGATLHVVGT